MGRAVRQPRLIAPIAEPIAEPGRREGRWLDLFGHEIRHVAIVGPSGSGKSTLMNILGLLDRADSGEYELDGQKVNGMSSGGMAKLRNTKIGFVFQQFHLLPRTNAVENVEIPLVYSNADNPQERAIAALKRVGLGERLKHYPEELSGGQQQRVAIARALVTDPDLILADEPTGNLDKASGEDLMGLFQELNNDGRTIVVITHDEKLAARAKRVVRIDEGRITEMGSGSQNSAAT